MIIISESVLKAALTDVSHQISNYDFVSSAHLFKYKCRWCEHAHGFAHSIAFCKISDAYLIGVKQPKFVLLSFQLTTAE